MPPGGVDVFGCSRQVCDRLLQLPEINSNLIALLFWLGYRREYVVYERAPRLEGKSAWTIGKKLRYGLNSIFNFTDLPIRVLLYFGTIAFAAACAGSGMVMVAKLRGDIPVPDIPHCAGQPVLRRLDELGIRHRRAVSVARAADLASASRIYHSLRRRVPPLWSPGGRG